MSKYRTFKDLKKSNHIYLFREDRVEDKVFYSKSIYIVKSVQFTDITLKLNLVHLNMNDCISLYPNPYHSMQEVYINTLTKKYFTTKREYNEYVRKILFGRIQYLSSLTME